MYELQYRERSYRGARVHPYTDMREWVVAFCLADRYVHIDHSGLH